MTTPSPLLHPGRIAQLRTALAESSYTKDNLQTLFGKPVAELMTLGHAGQLADLITDDDPASTLTRLFLAVEPVSMASLHDTGLPMQALLRAGVLEHVDDVSVRAKIRISPYEKWWVFSDLPPRFDAFTGREAVLPPVGATRNLQIYTMRDHVKSALDIGVGGGALSLYLAGHATKVTGTDVSQRALRFAATTAALNDTDWELLHGSLATPVEGRRFDLVTAALPISVGPGFDRLLFRDSGHPGDTLIARLAAAAPQLLTEGGAMQFVAQWPQFDDGDWQGRIASWADPELDLWATRHSSIEPEEYVESWLGDDPENDVVDRELWLKYLSDNEITSIGTGMITLRRSGHTVASVRIEDVDHLPTGVAVSRWLFGRDQARRPDWLEQTYRVPDEVLFRIKGQSYHAVRLLAGMAASLRRVAIRNGASSGHVVLDHGGSTLQADRLAVDLVANAGRRSPRSLGRILHKHGMHRLGTTEIDPQAYDSVIRLLERGILVPSTAA